eukprot:4198317-Karenia_brevis.AAC.1
MPKYRASNPKSRASVPKDRASVPKDRASIPKDRASVSKDRASVPYLPEGLAGPRSARDPQRTPDDLGWHSGLPRPKPLKPCYL